MADPLPADVKRFVNKHIHGVAQLELLLHLHDNPGQSVTPAMTAHELRLGEEQAAGLLHDLHTRGLLIKDDREASGRYRFQPRSRELARQVQSISKVYPTYRHRIIQLIFSKPPESVTNFAQAFRFRKDEDG